MARRFVWALPSAFMTKRRAREYRFRWRMNAILRPSGDHAGFESSGRLSVTLDIPLPSDSTT
jgi:hypothetical protein